VEGRLGANVANCIKFKVRPLLKWLGGKNHLARRIIELIPDSSIYVEPFAGGLNVLLNKCKCDVEIVGDLNTELIHLYETLRDHSCVLLDRIKDISFTEDVFKRALSIGVVEDPMERALNFLIKHRMSFAGVGAGFANPTKEDLDAWNYLPQDLKFTAHRIQEVEFYAEPALNLIDRYDGPSTSFYLDPPYYPSTWVGSLYEHEMTAFQHLILLRRIKKCQGHVIISGYDNLTYDRELQGWDKYIFDAVSLTSKVRSSRTEVAWVKPLKF
jgi:DNA adenine methylase